MVAVGQGEAMAEEEEEDEGVRAPQGSGVGREQ